MQPRSLEAILSELNTIYEPQIASVRQRQAQIPQQIQAEEQGLQAKQEQAFGDILGGARRRGLGFSGIPLSEQARYTSTEFLPALARLRQTGREQAMSLEDAILGIQERRGTYAQQLRQQELDRAEQMRQFNEQQRASAAARATPTLGGAGGQGGATDPIQQAGFDEALTRINSQSRDDLISDMISTLKGAAQGVPKDPYKIETYKRYAPELFAEAQRRFSGANRTASLPGLNVLQQSPFGLVSGNNSLLQNVRF